MTSPALTNLSRMYQRGTFTAAEYAQALRNLHNSSTDNDFRSAVRLRLIRALRAA